MSRAAFVFLLVLSFGCASPTISSAPVAPAAKPEPEKIVENPVADLRGAFLQAYDAGVEKNLENLKQGRPIVVNSLLDLVLYRANGETRTFPMVKTTYMAAAEASHPPLAIYSMIDPYGFGSLSEPSEKALSAYEPILREAANNIDAVNARPEVKRRMKAVLDLSIVYLDRTLASKTASRREFRRYVARVRPLIEANLYVGAREQLDQFLAQLQRWRSEYPDENWADMRVVILGFHQPRIDYSQMLLFRWLLHEGKFEHRVVYAEFQDRIIGKDAGEKSQQLALTLLSKVDLDRRAASAILGDQTRLARDVLGPATDQIIKARGAPDWPADENRAAAVSGEPSLR